MKKKNSEWKRKVTRERAYPATQVVINNQFQPHPLQSTLEPDNRHTTIGKEQSRTTTDTSRQLTTVTDSGHATTSNNKKQITITNNKKITCVGKSKRMLYVLNLHLCAYCTVCLPKLIGTPTTLDRQHYCTHFFEQ
jgi:hypothetical protein